MTQCLFLYQCLLEFRWGGYKFSFDYIFREIFPDLYCNVWFVPTYVVFYALHPLFNKIINNINQKQHFRILYCSFFFFGLFEILFITAFKPGELVYFSIIYFLVAYLKKYKQEFMSDRKKNLKWLGILSAIFVGLMAINAIISLTSNAYKNYPRLDTWLSPIFIPFLICLFNVFNNMKFSNKYINYFASCSLFVYCFHENHLVRSLLRPKFYAIVFNYPQFFYLWILICAIICFLFGYILSIIYKHTLHKLVEKLAIQAERFNNFCIDSMYKKLNKNSVIIDDNSTPQKDDKELYDKKLDDKKLKE